MVKAICIAKNRNDKGNIVNYTLKDGNGQIRSFTGKEIKEGIRAGQLEVKNLQIDKAGRLVDKAIVKESSIKQQAVQKEKQPVVTAERTENELLFLLANTGGVQCDFRLLHIRGGVYYKSIRDALKFDNEKDQNTFKEILINNKEFPTRTDCHKLVKKAMGTDEKFGYYFYVKHINSKTQKEDMMYYVAYNDFEEESECLTSEQALQKVNAVYEKYCEKFPMDEIEINFCSDRKKKFEKKLRDILFEEAKKSGISYYFNEDKWENVFPGILIFKQEQLINLYGLDISRDAYDLVDDMEREISKHWTDSEGYNTIYVNIVDEQGWLTIYKRNDLAGRKRAVERAAEEYHSLMSDSVCGIEDKEEYEEALANFFNYISTNVWRELVYTCSPYLCQDYILENRDDLIEEYGDNFVHTMLMYLSSLIKRGMCICTDGIDPEDLHIERYTEFGWLDGQDLCVALVEDAKEFCRKYELEYSNKLVEKLVEIDKSNYSLFKEGYNGQSIASQKLLKYLEKLAVRKRK